MFAVIGMPHALEDSIPFAGPVAIDKADAVEAWYRRACANIGADPDAMPGSADHEELIDVLWALKWEPVDTRIVADILGETLIVTAIATVEQQLAGGADCVVIHGKAGMVRVDAEGVAEGMAYTPPSEEPPIRVAVNVTGGMVQWVLADRPGVDVTIVDFDVEGHTDQDLKMIHDQDGRRDPANVFEIGIDIQPDYFERLDVAADVDGEGELAPHYCEGGLHKWTGTGTVAFMGPAAPEDSFSIFVEAADIKQADEKMRAALAVDYPGAKVGALTILPPKAAK